MTSQIRLLLAVSLLLSGANAQEEPLVFRGGTTLVEFTVIALDGEGDPVTDLSPQELSVREKGRPRELAFFRFEGGEQEETPVQLPAGSFTNRPELSPGPPRNVTAILLDSLNTQPEDQIYARAQVMRFMRELAPDTRVALYLLGRDLQVLHDFTDDPASLRDSIAKADTRLQMQMHDDVETMAIDAQAFIDSLPADIQASVIPSQTALIELAQMANQQSSERRTRQTLASLETLGDHLAGIPGRKSLVWISGGIQMLSITGQMGNGPRGGIKSYEDWMRATGQKLATQGVALYAVDARGNHGSSTSGGYEAKRVRTMTRDRGRPGIFEEQMQASAISNDPLPAMEKIAGITGGRAIFHTNDMTRGITAVASDVKGTYSLGFYTVDDPDGKWRPIDVKVSRDGVKLRYSQGYLAAAPTKTARPWTDQDWNTAITSPVSATTLAIDARGALASRGDVQEVSLTVQFAPQSLHFQAAKTDLRLAFVELALVDKAANGAFSVKLQQLQLPYNREHPDKPFQVHHSWTLAPGTDTVRVIVHDQLTGQFGTLDLPMAQLPRQAAQ
ncbi:MAG: VWA domain-containing protein [Acidobacteria bacterium]|nr:VWA domain-containing protein [Acidobacteriota bacterium]MDA1233483.1 VWA domain-containing protein [Acidobacteriota bacterium]